VGRSSLGHFAELATLVLVHTPSFELAEEVFVES
jgi:hypothetical protein